MSGYLIHSERNCKSLFLKYEIYNNKLRIQTLLIFYFLEIPFEDIERVEIGHPPVFWDIIKKNKVNPKHGFGVRILKNDLADLFKHIIIIKKKGYWKEIRITPENPDDFLNILNRCLGS
ncbi:hypothetical protein ACFLZ0_01930 [Patescibacteria group bacterium]